MPLEEVTSSVEAIETRAEEILREAQSQANEILREASEEASRIISAKVSLNEAEAEGELIINRAKEEEERAIEESRKKGSEIRASASNQVEKIVQRMVDIIIGTELK